MPENKSAQLAVVGAGPGGYAAAFMAADLGLKVTLIDPAKNPGGVCLYIGCIPSKALLHVAKLIFESQQSRDWGLTYPPPKIDIDKLRSWKDDVVTRLTGGLGQLTRQRKVNYIRGTASFQNANTLEIKTHGGGTELLTFEQAILATGSSPATIPNLAPQSPRILDSTSALELENIPKTMLIIGGGYIGLELGTVYASLGTKITLVEMLPGLLPGADRDLVNVLHKRVEGIFESIMLNTTVASMQEQKDGIRVKFQSRDQSAGEKVFEKVLVSVGRKPNSANLGLDKTKVQIDKKGYVKIDAQRRTAEPSIYAIGDIAGEPLLAHKATHEGRTAAEVIAGHKVAFEPRAIPAVVFTDPEIAWCGLTEDDAKKQSRNIKIAKYPWAASGRALTLGRSDGFTKLIIDPESERILGAGIVGTGAGELIAECVLAIEMAALASDIGLTIHPHPTLTETVMEAADVYFGQSTHYFRPRRD